MLQTNYNIYDRARLWSQSLEAPGDKNMHKLSQGLARIGIESKQEPNNHKQPHRCSVAGLCDMGG